MARKESKTASMSSMYEGIGFDNLSEDVDLESNSEEKMDTVQDQVPKQERVRKDKTPVVKSDQEKKAIAREKDIRVIYERTLKQDTAKIKRVCKQIYVPEESYAKVQKAIAEGKVKSFNHLMNTLLSEFLREY